MRGQQGADNLRAVRLAVDEAAWVEERLQSALEWCAAQHVKKMKVSSMVQARRGKRRCVSLLSLSLPRAIVVASRSSRC